MCALLCRISTEAVRDCAKESGHSVFGINHSIFVLASAPRSSYSSALALSLPLLPLDNHLCSFLTTMDHGRRPRPRRKLPCCRPLGLGLGPQHRRWRRGTRPTTSSIDSAAVRRHTSRLCHRRSPQPCTLLITPRRSLRRSKMHRFRSVEAPVAKPLFTNDRWCPLLHRNAFRLNEMAVVAALQPSFSADSELVLELCSRGRRSHGRPPDCPTRVPARPPRRRPFVARLSSMTGAASDDRRACWTSSAL